MYFNNLPTLEIKKGTNSFKYRFKADVANFEMPIAMNIDGNKVMLIPSANWQTHRFEKKFKVYDDLYYINIKNINTDDKELLSLNEASSNL